MFDTYVKYQIGRIPVWGFMLFGVIVLFMVRIGFMVLLVFIECVVYDSKSV